MPSSSTTAPTPTSGDPTCPSFICDDQGSAGGACDLYAQDCPEGEKCAPVITDGGGDWNAFICVPVSGTDMPGDPCIAESSADGLDSCEKGGIVLGCRHGRQRHLCRAMHRFS
jgi:hypothetical protein